jgi:hypothetical protein
VIHEYPPDRARSKSVELRAVFPRRAALPQQPHECFVHQLRGLKSVAGFLTPERTYGDAVQRLLDASGKAIRCVGIALAG